MIRIALPLLAALALSACTAATGYGIEPIPGSITYGGHQPRTKLTKAPVGSTFEHRFYDGPGRQVFETYQIQPDRSILLIRRRVRLDYF
ncbi:MAG: hypothetical protein WA950_12825 [Shinella sp.]|jgi:hypothetical protein|uniref:hypothetical protein n=1 Tax=Shinella sp. TaxID=1870904 RepID=UPI003C760099